MPRLSFSAWMAPGDAAALASLEAHAGLLARLYPLWYAGGPQGLPLRRAESGLEERRRVADLARAAGSELWPHARVQPGCETGFLGMLGDAGLRRAHAVALLKLVQEDTAQGVDLDYTSVPHDRREGLQALFAEVCAQFHAAGLKVGLVLRVATPASGIPEATGISDAALLAPLCDRLQLVGAYPGLNQSEVDAGPRPIAAPQWYAAVLPQVLGSVPAEQLEGGLPGCGRLWEPGQAPVDLPWPLWEQIVKAHSPERRDPHSAELKLRYDGREAWMNDAISLTAKLWQLRLHGVSEAALWGLGSEDPRLWALVDSLPEEFLDKGEA